MLRSLMYLFFSSHVTHSTLGYLHLATGLLFKSLYEVSSVAGWITNTVLCFTAIIAATRTLTANLRSGREGEDADDRFISQQNQKIYSGSALCGVLIVIALLATFVIDLSRIVASDFFSLGLQLTFTSVIISKHIHGVSRKLT